MGLYFFLLIMILINLSPAPHALSTWSFLPTEVHRTLLPALVNQLHLWLPRPPLLLYCILQFLEDAMSFKHAVVFVWNTLLLLQHSSPSPTPNFLASLQVILGLAFDTYLLSANYVPGTVLGIFSTLYCHCLLQYFIYIYLYGTTL